MAQDISPLNLACLPVDILFAIYARLHLLDVLSLKQTCRVLHAFGCSDYLWHLMMQDFDLPLNISANVQLGQLSGKELQVLAIRAIRLERNWAKPEPQVKALTAVISGNVVTSWVDSMILLPGAQWLLVALRHAATGCGITVWSLHHPESRQVAILDIKFPHRFYSFAAGMNDDGDATVSVYLNESPDCRVLYIYALPLREYLNNEFSSPATPSVLLRYSLVNVNAATFSVSNGIIATVAIEHIDGPTPSGTYRILFLNSYTGATGSINPRLPEVAHDLKVRLCCGHAILICNINQEFCVQVYSLPASMLLSPMPSVDAETDIGQLVSHYRSSATAISPHDLVVSDGQLLVNNDIARLAIKMVPCGRNLDPQTALLYRLHLELSASSQTSGEPILVLPTPLLPQLNTEGASQTHRYLGNTGHKAVWKDYNFEKEETRLMKFSMNSQGAVADVLISARPTLPFTPASCHSLAFDEAAGRLCVGLQTGELYVLDY